MAEKAEHVGVEKTRLDFMSLLALAVLACAFVAFGSMFSIVVSAGAEGVPDPHQRSLHSILFVMPVLAPF